MRHHDIPERDQLAAARQSCLRQFDGEGVKDFNAGAGLAQSLAALLDQAIGNTAFAGAAVFGALLLRAQHDRGLAAAGTIGAAGLVAMCLFLFGFLHAALSVA